MRTLKTKYFIGIDISKNKLDIALVLDGNLIDHQTIANTSSAVQKYLDELKGLKCKSIRQVIFCMENTGVYGNILIGQLLKKKAIIAVENGMHIKQSMGLVRDKSDKKDALRIALFAEKNSKNLRFWEPPRPVIVKLRHLSQVRERLLNVVVKLQLPIKENGAFIDSAMGKLALECSILSIDAVKADLQKVERQISEQIKADERLARLNALITSVPGVGDKTALQIIIRTNEFKTISDPKKFACYAGVVPFKKESGVSTSRAKISGLANKKLKSLLHMCAFRAIRVDSEIAGYYERKTQVDKKAKMSVINAIRNKLILRVFACVRNDKAFIKRE